MDGKEPRGIDYGGARRSRSAPRPRRHAAIVDRDSARIVASPAPIRRRRWASGAGLNRGIAVLPRARAPVGSRARSKREAMLDRAAPAHWAANEVESTSRRRTATPVQSSSVSPAPPPAFFSAVLRLPPPRL